MLLGSFLGGKTWVWLALIFKFTLYLLRSEPHKFHTFPLCMKSTIHAVKKHKKKNTNVFFPLSCTSLHFCFFIKPTLQKLHERQVCAEAIVNY